MSDQRGVVAALAALAERGELVVMASVVRIVGAAYRGVGARMLVRTDGSTVGMVSAGCLEADLIAHADRVRAAGEPVVITYDTRADDEVVWGLGLGCDGIVEVLLEPLAPARARALAAFLGDVLAREQVTVLATVIRADGVGAPRPGARALAGVPDSHAASEGDWGDETALAHVLADPLPSLPDLRLLTTHSAGALASVDVAYEVVAPAVRLVICGSGPDVVPVVRLAIGLGWEVTVVAPHAASATGTERFPGAQVVVCDAPEQLADTVALTASTAAVVMSHDYNRDRGYVDALLRSTASYVGVMGPRRRTERMLANLAAEGRRFDADRLARLYAPVGLDVGGDGPEAIALAVVAEVSAVTRGRAGGHLRARQGPIHSSVDNASAKDGSADSEHVAVMGTRATGAGADVPTGST